MKPSDMNWIIWILFAHFVADFFCQSDWMAQNKSKDSNVLAIHCLIYGAIIGLMTLNPLWAILNMVCHFIVDYFTSRASSKLWSKKKVHWFFVMIGFDQFIHTAILIYTWRIFNL